MAYTFIIQEKNGYVKGFPAFFAVRTAKIGGFHRNRAAGM